MMLVVMIVKSYQMH
jgi:hypothetical protein